MDKNMSHKTILDCAIKCICEEYADVIAIVLFGSFGTEYERADSDIDLAVLSKGILDPVPLWNLAQRVASEVHKDVQLIDLHESSTVFRFQIFSSGTLIFCSDKSYFAHFETTAFSMYYRFQEERKEIVQEYLNDG